MSYSYGPELFIVTQSYSLHHDPNSFMSSMALSYSLWLEVTHFIHDLESLIAFQALRSRPRVVRILYIPKMFCFHHSSHLWVVLTQHYESKSILIGYPFRALSSGPWVVLLIYDPESSIAFRALSSWLRVVLLVPNLESSIAFKALRFRPRVIHST